MAHFTNSIAMAGAFALLLGSTAVQGQGAQGTWSVLGQLPSPRTGIGVVESGSKIYLMDGQINGRTDSPMAQEYDPATGRFRDLPNMP